MKKIIVFIFLIVILSGCSNTNNINIEEKEISCTVDEDCMQYRKELNCPIRDPRKELIHFEPICEYNKCICGCGDPENGKLCT